MQSKLITSKLPRGESGSKRLIGEWQTKSQREKRKGEVFGNREEFKRCPDGVLKHTKTQGWQEEKIESRKANIVCTSMNGKVTFCCYVNSASHFASQLVSEFELP